MTTTLGSREQQKSPSGAGLASTLRAQTLVSLATGGASAGAKRPATGKEAAGADQLIDSKFNELSKKILEELRQAHYSSHFFRALDEILGEPVAKDFAHIYRNSHNHCKHYEQKQQQQQQEQKRRLQSLNSDNNSQRLFQREPLTGHHQHHQPRSLPLEVAFGGLSQQQLSVVEKSKNNQTTQTDFKPHSMLAQQQRDAMTTKGVLAASNSYPISKSATVSDTQSVRRQLSSSSGRSAVRAEPLVEPGRNQSPRSHGNQAADRQQFYRKQRNHSASSISRIVASYELDEDYHNDDDDEDDEDDDEDDETDEGQQQWHERGSGSARRRQSSSAGQMMTEKSRGSFLGQRYSNPIVKSKTSSDANNIIESAQRQQPDSSKQQSVHEQRQRFGNPIVRSSTISGAHGSARQQHLYQQHQQQRTGSAEPRSMNLLSHKDMGLLYKPHMNYSTNLLGNHRLSDDDEIIIIPTQSPTLSRSSPTDAEANEAAEQQIERFSISRTKSFWEKLSKGSKSGNKLTAAATSPTGLQQSDGGGAQAPSSAIRSSGGQINYPTTTGGNNNKLTGGARANGHLLDRMDSTGGSNSNQSCSSSGDENNCSSTNSHRGHHQHQHPASNHHHHQHPSSGSQEMCRQNILRQTR